MADNTEVLARTSQPRNKFRSLVIFFAILLGLNLAMFLGVEFLGMDRGIRNGTLTGTAFAAVIGTTIWYLQSSYSSRRLRWVVALAFWAILFVLHNFVIDFKLDGDIGIIGVRFAWQPKPDTLLKEELSKSEIATWNTTPFDYPRFLGNGYWAEVKNVQLDPNWKDHPTKELWRRKIGAGWSAFAVVGDYAYTQEQRGDQELVTCYRVVDGKLMWSHVDKVRFDPQDLQGNLGGLGPRATPTLYERRVYTQGATGIINCLDAETGSVVWSHDIRKELGYDEEAWGFQVLWGQSGSPLVVPKLDYVAVSVGAPVGATSDFQGSMITFDLTDGKVVWKSGWNTTSYASPVLATFKGIQVILQVNADQINAYRASDGVLIWEYPWPSQSDGSAAASQPVPLPDNRFFISKGYGLGSSLLQVISTKDWKNPIKPLWDPPIKPVMKTKFCNVVIRDGFVYGIDDILLQCIELETGKQQWKKRRRAEIGHGQVLLVGDILLVTTEQGEVVLVECNPKKYVELAAFRAFEEGICWNNPALAGDKLLVRNELEAACFQLPLKKPTAK